MLIFKTKQSIQNMATQENKIIITCTFTGSIPVYENRETIIHAAISRGSYLVRD